MDVQLSQELLALSVELRRHRNNIDARAQDLRALDRSQAETSALANLAESVAALDGVVVSLAVAARHLLEQSQPLTDVEEREREVDRYLRREQSQPLTDVEEREREVDRYLRREVADD